MKTFFLLAAILNLTLMMGCGGGPYELAPVSGTVTLNGEPLADATVSYEPMRAADKEVVGPGSVGKTDEAGKYELETYKQETGAVVGKHKVRISTFKSVLEDIKNSDAVKVVSQEKVPWNYNRHSSLSVKVPSDGTDTADFALVGEAPRKQK